MSILTLITISVVLAFLACMVVPGDNLGGPIAAFVVGVLGALVGNWLSYAFIGGFTMTTTLIGAFAFVFVLKQLATRDNH